MYEIKTKLGAATTAGAAEITGHGAYKEYRAIQEARKRQGRTGRSASISMDLPLAEVKEKPAVAELANSDSADSDLEL